MKKVLEDMVSKPNVILMSNTKRYFFKHTTKKERKKGKDGFASHAASLFLEVCKNLNISSDYYYFGEDGTGVEITEIIEQ